MEHATRPAADQTVDERHFLLRYLPLAVAGSAAYAMSTLFSAMKPVMLTRFVEQVGFAEALAGLIVAMPFVGIALSALTVHAVLQRFSYRQIVLLFGLVLCGTELLSGFIFAHAWAIGLAQFLGGLSVGLLMGATSRLIATTSAPARLFGFVDMMAVLLMSFMVFGVGESVEQAGLAGGYGFATVLALLFAAAMLVLDGGPRISSTALNSQGRLQFGPRPVAVVAMGVLFVTFSGLGFAFMFTLARNLGMGYDIAGRWIGIVLFLSAFACQAGGWASARFGPYRPLAAAFAVCAFGWYVAVHAQSVALFFAGLVPAVFALQFNFPVLLSVAGSLDADGQWAAIASPLLTSGFAWAAIVAGQLVGLWGLDALALGTMGGMCMCLLLLQFSRERGRERVRTDDA